MALHARWLGFVLLLAVVLRLALGAGYLGYDGAWALVWGREAAGGALPSLQAAGAPTAHPLLVALAALLSLLGGGAASAFLALAWLSLAAIGALAFALGRTLFSPAVGAVFAALLLTRGLLVDETRQAIVDVPFLALVLAALLLEARRPLAGLRVPALLGVAGLLRPEAWLLGAAWVLAAAPRQDRRLGVAQAGLVAVGPLLWGLQDLVVTGDPLFSLHATRSLAAELDRPTATSTALAIGPAYLRAALGDPVAWLGLAGAAAALVLEPGHPRLPLALLGLGLAGFLALGLAGLPLLIRYVLVPATMLALFCALLAAGWTAMARDAAARRGWVAAGVVACVVLLAALPGDLGGLVQQRSGGIRARVQADLDELLARPAVREAAARCGTLAVPDARPLPLAILRLGRPVSTVTIAGAGRLRLAYASAAAAAGFAIPARAGAVPPAGPPAGGRPVARNRSWVLVAASC